MTQAITQAEKYLYNAVLRSRNLEGDIKRKYNIDVKIIKPKCRLIIGHSNQLNDINKEEDFRILRSSYKNIEVILYDELLEGLKNQGKKIYLET